MTSQRFSKISRFLTRNGLRIALPLLLLLLSFISYRITILPASSGKTVLVDCARFVLPVITVISVLLSALRRHASAFSLFIGYHVGVFFAFLAGGDTSVFLLTLSLSLITSLLIGVWLEVFSVLLKKWKEEADS